jgi:glycosyltransferase involved in cell wall biosynthesis
VVANGVDAEAFSPRPAREDLRRRWGLEHKDVILYAGTFQPYEGLDLLVRAIGDMVRQRPNAHLVIVGGTAGMAGAGGSVSAEEARLRSIVRENDLGTHVTFTGRIPHAEVIDMYALAQIMAYPRIWTRTTALTTPLKPLEAMAMAKPVIACDLPPMCELIADGATGLLFKTGDYHDLAAKCLDVLADPTRGDRLGAAARAWVLRNRSWRTLVTKYQSVYESVLHHSARTAEPIRRRA